MPVIDISLFFGLLIMMVTLLILYGGFLCLLKVSKTFNDIITKNEIKRIFKISVICIFFGWLLVFVWTGIKPPDSRRVLTPVLSLSTEIEQTPNLLKVDQETLINNQLKKEGEEYQKESIEDLDKFIENFSKINN